MLNLAKRQGGRVVKTASVLGLRALLLTLLAMAVLNLAMLWSAGLFEREDGESLFAVPVIRQAHAAAELMDGLPSEDRRRAATALTSSFLRFELIADFSVTPALTDPEPVFVPIIEAYRRRLDGRAFSVYARENLTTIDRFLGQARIIDNIIVVLKLSDGAGLAVEAGADYRRRIALNAMLYVVAVVGLVMIGLFSWAAYSYAPPLTRLARAAERLDEDLDSDAPIAVSGPKPVRTLAHVLAGLRGRLRALLAERTTTLAAIAHDMRTYLTRLRMRAEFIDDAEQRAKAVRDVEDMSALLEDTLSLGAATMTPAQRTPFDAAKYLEDFAARRQETAPDAVTLHVAEEMRGRLVYASADDLTRALNNLVDNALRYAGSAALRLEADGDGARFCVDDDGPGVPENFISRMTDPFTRVEGSRSRDTGGSGLGLAIAKARAERAGGELILANRPSGGFSAVVRFAV